MNSVSFTIKSRTTQIRHASPNPLFFRTLHIQLPKASPSSCSFPVTPPQSFSTQAKVHHQQSLPWLLQFQSRRDGTRSRTWTFAPSSSHCKGIGKRQRLFLSWQARAGLPLLSLGAQGWLEAEEKRNPSPGCTQMETLHIVHFLTPAETGWPLPRNHASGQRGFPQEPTNKPEKKRKKKKGWSTQKAPRGSRLAWRRQRWSLRYLHHIIFFGLQRQQRFSSLSPLTMPCPCLLPNWIQPLAQLFLPRATPFLLPQIYPGIYTAESGAEWLPPSQPGRFSPSAQDVQPPSHISNTLVKHWLLNKKGKEAEANVNSETSKWERKWNLQTN